MLKYYLILGLELRAADEEVRRSYLRLVKRYPPERAPEIFAKISEAYEALKDEPSRIQAGLKGSLQVPYPVEELASLPSEAISGREALGLGRLLEWEKAASP